VPRTANPRTANPRTAIWFLTQEELQTRGFRLQAEVRRTRVWAELAEGPPNAPQIDRLSAAVHTARRRGRPRPASAVRKIVAARTLASLVTRRVGMRLGDRCQAELLPVVVVRPTRITETGLAARNRRADFPASPRMARSRRPRPPSTGAPRKGSAQRILEPHRRVLGGRDSHHPSKPPAAAPFKFSS